MVDATVARNAATRKVAATGMLFGTGDYFDEPAALKRPEKDPREDRIEKMRREREEITKRQRARSVW